MERNDPKLEILNTTAVIYSIFYERALMYFYVHKFLLRKFAACLES